MNNNKDLKPELKEVYERVMSTKTPVRNSTPNTPPAEQKISPSLPVTPAAPVSEPTKEPFLASSAPRAVNTTSSFVFSSKDKIEQPHDKIVETNLIKDGKPEKSKSAKKNGSLIKVIVVGLVVFIIVWTFFWMFYFQLI